MTSDQYRTLRGPFRSLSDLYARAVHYIVVTGQRVLFLRDTSNIILLFYIHLYHNILYTRALVIVCQVLSRVSLKTTTTTNAATFTCPTPVRTLLKACRPTIMEKRKSEKNVFFLMSFADDYYLDRTSVVFVRVCIECP